MRVCQYKELQGGGGIKKYFAHRAAGHSPKLGVVLFSNGLQSQQHVMSCSCISFQVKPSLRELSDCGTDDVQRVEIVPDRKGRSESENEFEETALEQVANAVEEEGQDGGDEVLRAFAAHGEQLDGFHDTGGDGGDGEELPRFGNVRLDNVDLAALVGDDLEMQ